MADTREQLSEAWRKANPEASNEGKNRFSDLLSDELLLELWHWIRDNHPKCSDFDVRDALIHLAKTDFIKILR
tara:strand:+ start:2234 stop:2452 length:219 start_codon:yes stop_codon:yes gene_type:complete